jgi:aerobic-type carbon monoxide dehydrogenase small subunit (CoxS/CutS family)
MYITEPGCGIATVEVDGTSVGTVDTYSAASEVDHVVTTLSGIVVASSAMHTLTMLMATKNASSTGYVLLLQWLTLRRTA